MTPGCLSFSKKVTLWYGVLISFLAFLVTRYVSQTEEPLSDGALVSNDTSPQKKHFILLGSTGDLAIRYLLPALLTLQSVSRNGWIIHSASRQEPAEIQRVLFQKLTFDGADVDPEWSKFLSSLVPVRLSNDEDFQAFCQQVPSDSRILFYLSYTSTRIRGSCAKDFAVLYGKTASGSVNNCSGKTVWHRRGFRTGFVS